MSAPEGQYYVHSTAHPVVGGPVSHDEAIAALGALDNAYVQSPAASARRRDTADVIEHARRVLAESYDGIDPDVETRHDGAVANLAAAGLLALAASPAAPQAAEVAQAFHEAYERLAPSFGYETRKASAKPWSDVPEPNRSLMIAVASEVLASLSAPAPADDEAAQVERMARALARRFLERAVQGLVTDEEADAGWNRMPEADRSEFLADATAALAALKEGQR